MDLGLSGLPLALILSLLLGSGAGLPVALPPGPPDVYLDQIAPPECVYYTCWSPAAAPQQDSKHPVEQFFAEPEIQRLRTAIDKPWDWSRLTNGRHGLKKKDAELWRLAARLLKSRPVALYVEQLGVFADAKAPLRGAVVVHLGPQLENVRAQLERRLATVSRVELRGTRFYRFDLEEGDDQPVEITIGIRGPRLIMACGSGVVEELLAREGTPPPDWLWKLRSQPEIPRIATISYVDLQAFGRQSNVNRWLTPEWGLNSARSYVAVSGLDEQGYVCRASLELQRPLPAILQVLETAPLTEADLSPIPSTATVALAMKMDLRSVLQRTREAVGAERVDGALSAAERVVGARLREGLIESLGDVWTLHTAPEDGGILMGWTATVPIRDRSKVQLTLALDRVRQAAAKGTSVKVHEFAGESIYELDTPRGFLPLQPSYCVTPTHLVAGLNAAAVRSWLQRREDAKLSSQPSVARLFQRRPPHAIAYANQRRLIEDVYPWAQLAWPQVRRQLSRQGYPCDHDWLPSQTTLTRFAKKSASGLTVTREKTRVRIDYEQRQALPGGAAAASGPLLLGLSLPWMAQQSR